MKAASPYHFPVAIDLELDLLHRRMGSVTQIDTVVAASYQGLVIVILHMHLVGWDSPLEASYLEQDFVLGNCLEVVDLALELPFLVLGFGLVDRTAGVVDLPLSSSPVRDFVDLRV